jgi:hypothetical protein
VYGTREVINQGHLTRSSPPRLALPIFAEPRLPRSRGAMGLRRTRAFPENGSLAIFPPRSGSPAQAGLVFVWRGLSSPGKFSARVLAKLGLVRRLSYHDLQIPAQHKSMSRQKIWRSPRFPSGRPLYLSGSPAAPAASPVMEAMGHRGSGISYHHGFHNRSIQKED